MIWRLSVWIGLAVICADFSSSSDCPASDNESLLQPGYEYTYHFKSEAFAEAVGTTNDGSKMIIDCSVHVSHVHDCIYNLMMRECTLSASGGTPDSEVLWMDKKPLPELSRWSIMFSLSNGEVKEIYANEDDPIFYLNIKRGALSAFVFKMSSTSSEIKEMHTDIHGTCPFHSSPVPNTAGTVQASKDMMHCAYPSRPDWQLSPWSMFWNMSFIQYVINSTMDCRYKVDVENQQLEKLFCKERHAIGLESTHHTTTAVQTNILYYMDLQHSSKLKENMNHPIPTRKSGIQYEYEQTKDPTPETEPSDFNVIAKKILSDLVEISQDEIRLFSIPKFTDLVAWLRSAHDILPLIEAVKSCTFLEEGITCTEAMKELAMSYMSDALVQCNTVPCFRAVAHMAINGDFSETYLNFALYSFNNMHFTKPEIITHVKAICKATNSRFCWLVLGTMVKNYIVPESSREPSKELADVVAHFYSNIGPACEGSPDYNSDKQFYQQLITYIKAIGNIGTHIYYAPSGPDQLLKCITHQKHPLYIKVAAFETLFKINPCTEINVCKYMHRKVLPILHNSSYDDELRIAAYKLLMLAPEEGKFEIELMNFLTEVNPQVASYVASDLISKMYDDDEYRKLHDSFVESFKSFLKSKTDIRLEFLQDFQDKTSHSSLDGHFFKLPFLPQEMQEFGATLGSSVFFPYYNHIPQSLMKNLTVQLFGKMFNLFQVGAHFEGWEPIAILVENYLRSSSFSWEKLDTIIEKVMETVTSQKNSFDEYKFNKNIINNIKKIHDTYKEHKLSIKSFFTFYLDMFGSTLGFLTPEDIPKILNDVGMFLNKIKQGFAYDTTRVIRVIEAYHQVPTMMGLPLNWTTSATLAFSVRTGMEVSVKGDQDNSELQFSGFFQPSAALTFLNRMVLDFPSFTQIGVQANSSGYTSTQFKGSVDYEYPSGYVKYRLQAPQKTQKILELFRTNQLIKHDVYQDIPDWDIERTSVSWCSDGGVSSALGFEMCHERSYPDVTHRIKPWALMAGWCKWRLELIPYDRELRSYNLEVMDKGSKTGVQDFNIKFSAPGSSLKREILYNFKEDKEEGEMSIKIIIPDLPSFMLDATSYKIAGDGKTNGYRSVVILKMAKELKYTITYNREQRSEKHEDKAVSKNKSPKPQMVITTVQEAVLNIETPYNGYTWTRKIHMYGGNMKMDILFTYLNREKHWNWLRYILPSPFWENESKALLHFDLDSKGSSHISKDVTTNRIRSNIVTPGSTIALLSNTLNMPGREQLNINLTKTDSSSGLILSFANFTYDLWESGTTESVVKQIKSINFTIPLHSWSYVMKNTVDGERTVYDIGITKAKMIRKHEDIKGENYVGWWSEDVKDDFELVTKEVKLKADINSKHISEQELLNEVSSVTQDDIKGLHNQYIKADIELSYPFVDQEFLTFNGVFLVSASQNDMRFQKDFNLHSSYHNLRLTSHSVYLSRLQLKRLMHNSYFTHTTTDEKAFYNMDYSKINNQQGCTEIDFKHNISSHFLDFSSDVSYHCDSRNPILKTLILNLDSHSRYWAMLDAKIRQKIEGTPDLTIEYMNFTHPYMKIDVEAEWKNTDHKKKAVFTKLPEQEVVTIIDFNSTPWERNLKIFMPKDGTEINYSRYSDGKHVKSDIFYPDNKHQALSLHGTILDLRNRLWILRIFPEASHMSNFLREIMKNLKLNMANMINNPNHPLNEMLEPALKMPLGEYLQQLKEYAKMSAYNTLMSMYEGVVTLEPFYSSPVAVITNSYNAVVSQIKKLYSVVDKHSITIWAIKYFNLPEYIHQGILHFNQGLSFLTNVIAPPNQVHRYVFHTANFIEWEDFNKIPSLSVDRLKHYILSLFGKEQKEMIEPFYEQQEGSKVAMIFGPRHVYTFQKSLYEFPSYPSEDCSYLLAHDTHWSQFSVIATENYIRLLFPGITVSINSRKEVYINENPTQVSLPVQSENGDVTIKREGNVISVQSPALTVLCDGYYDLCLLEISGWSYGGTIGLLGNARGDAGDSIILPNGTSSQDIMELAQSYELTGREECKVLHYRDEFQSAEVYAKHRDHCQKLVKTTCKIVQQNLFVRPCILDMINDDNAHFTEAALSTLCYYKYGEVNLKDKMPETRRIRHKLEVVFIVNRHSSMMSKSSGRKMYKSMESIINALEHQFTSNGYSSITYSLVGFGGNKEYNHPTIYTVQNDIWVAHKYAKDDLLNVINFDGREKSDPVEALQYAAEILGFNTHDTKVFIMLTDEDVQSSNREVVKKIQGYLDRNLITLYTIANYPSIEKGKKVYGVRADGLMFPSPTKDGEAYLDYPRGDLAKLTSGTRGSVFLKKFLDSNGPAAFFTEFAEEVWAKVRKEVQYCRICKSVQSGWWYVNDECYVTDCEKS